MVVYLSFKTRMVKCQELHLLLVIFIMLDDIIARQAFIKVKKPSVCLKQ